VSSTPACSNYDTTLAYLSLADAQRFFDMRTASPASRCGSEEVYGAREVGGPSSRARGISLSGARDWMEVNRNLFSALKLEKVVYGIVLCLIVVVAVHHPRHAHHRREREAARHPILKSDGRLGLVDRAHLHPDRRGDRRRACSATSSGSPPLLQRYQFGGVPTDVLVTTLPVRSIR